MDPVTEHQIRRKLDEVERAILEKPTSPQDPRFPLLVAIADLTDVVRAIFRELEQK
jgi:hypothetical protein